MYNHGDAAEQVMRMTLQGVEVTARISGHAAKHIALLLIAIAKEQEKTKGKTRLSSMLKSGKPLKVFTIKESDLREFTREAKRYGVLYCALRGKAKNPDGQVDIMAPAEDAPKINRIVKRFHFAEIDTAAVTTEIEKNKSTPEKEEQISRDLDRLADMLMGGPDALETEQPENPPLAKMKNPQSEPISKTPKRAEVAASKEEKPSIKKLMDEMKAARKERASRKPKVPVRAKRKSPSRERK